MDALEVKDRLGGQCVEFLASLGIDASVLDGKHHPCPKCGGTDRFRMIDVERGAVYCNQCFRERNGDVIAATMWWTGCTMPEAIAKILDYLAVFPPVTRERRKKKPRRLFANQGSATHAMESYMKTPATDHWVYRGMERETLAVVYRWDLDDGKTIRTVSKIEGGWIIGAPHEGRPLYNLPEIVHRPTVFVVEGEKAALAARGIGLPATTSMGGASAAKCTDWTPLAERTVILLPDNDPPGEAYARDVAGILIGLGCWVKLLRLPGLTEGGDIADYIAQRHGERTRTIRDGIWTLVETASHEAK